MTAELGGRGNIRHKQVEGGRQKGSSLSLSLEEEEEEEEEEGGIEVLSKIDFRDPRFTSTSNSYWNTNGCTRKIIDVLSGK